MRGRLEVALFAATLAAVVGLFFHESLFGGKVLSPADVLFVTAGFRDVKGPDYEPLNRLLIDPVLQFQPWLEWNQAELWQGRLPTWNPYVGCGAPHLANGQSAVFDPFHLLAYLGTFPDAHAWMAWGRLWVAGVGMFLLARQWRLRRWGRWFAGLVYPFSGFIVVWLLYPVTNVAIWFPWVMLGSDRLLDRPSLLRIGLMAVGVGLCLLGGHVQTSAHVLLAVGLNLVWRVRSVSLEAILGWLAGVVLGVGIAAIEVVPLGDYLTRSPVWTDRALDRKPPWSLVRPRVLETVCNAIPYAYGSQRRGHPNLARGLGVENLNESSGGFAGLATLLWLAPLAWASRKRPRVRWLFGLTLLGFLGSGRWPPLDNLLRAIPILNVTDNRRLSLWVAFGLTLLGGVGLDRLGAVRRGRWPVRWMGIWLTLAVLACLVALVVGRFEPRIRARAEAHYDAMARQTPGADRAVFQARAERQTRDTMAFLPRYYGLVAAQLVGLSGWLFLIRTRRLGNARIARGGLLGLVVADVFLFGVGLNPAIPREDDRPVTDLIRHLRKVAPPPSHVLGVGEELPPNVAMRYRLADIRNYDSVELASSVGFFEPLYSTGSRERTSRRDVTWAGVARARGRLKLAGVAAVVGATAPPEGLFDVVDRVGAVWVGRWERRPNGFEPEGSGEGASVSVYRGSPTQFLVYLNILMDNFRSRVAILRETWDVGWTSSLRPNSGSRPFLHGFADPGANEIMLQYEPLAVEIGGKISLLSLGITVFALTRFLLFPSTRIVHLRLGWNRARGIESDSIAPSPDDPTGEFVRTKR